MLGVRIIVSVMLLMMIGAAGDAADVDLGLSDFRQGRFAEAFQDWRQAAAAGDARGALYVGVLYDSGLGATQDYRQAMTWYRQAADAGSAAGAFNIGVLYDAGLGTPKDAEQAASWYARAAARGFGRAEYNLAMLYESGTGVPRSRERAVALYRNAALHGITAARMHLAMLGVPFADPPQKLQDTSMQDFERAQQMLLSRGPALAAQATVLFRRAAEQHNPLAEYDLAYCYEHAMGVPLDLSKAYDWYRRAIGDATSSALRSLAEIGASNLESRLAHNQIPTPGASRPSD